MVGLSKSLMARFSVKLPNSEMVWLIFELTFTASTFCVNTPDDSIVNTGPGCPSGNTPLLRTTGL